LKCLDSGSRWLFASLPGMTMYSCVKLLGQYIRQTR
jgi:hypothetical protein